MRLYHLLLSILATLAAMVSLSHPASGQSAKSPSGSQQSDAKTQESEVLQTQNLPSIPEKTVSSQEPENLSSGSWIMYSGYLPAHPHTTSTDIHSTSGHDSKTPTLSGSSLPQSNVVVPTVSTPEFSRNQEQKLKVEGSNQPIDLSYGKDEALQLTAPPKIKVEVSNQPAYPAYKKVNRSQPIPTFNPQVAQTSTPSPTPSPQPATPETTPSPQPVTPNPATPTPETTPSPQPVTPNPATPTPETTPNPSTPTPQENQPQPRVLVGEVAVTGTKGELPADLQNRVYQAIRTRPGRTATRDQLQDDVKAIYATGYFAKVNVVPEDTPLGVRVTFVVEPNPVLQSVTLSTVPGGESSRIATPQVVNNIFSQQYGRNLNLNDLQSGIQKLNQYYKDKGYDLAQVIEAPQISDDGKVTLVVAEGVIENIQVRYINKDTKQPTDPQGRPVRGRTRPFIITREIALKPGDVFNRQTAQTDLRRVYSLGIFDDVQLSFSPGEDPRRVNVLVDVIEKNTGSIAAGAGYSSASGLFGTISYQQQNLGGNDQKLGGEVEIGQRELLFDVNFTDPWIAGDPYRTSYTIDAFRRSTISLVFDNGRRQVNLPNGDTPRILRYGTGVTFSRPLSKDPLQPSEWVASLGLQAQQVTIRDSNGNLRKRDELGNLLTFNRGGIDYLTTLQFGVSRDLRDDPLRPIRGSVLRLGVEQSIPLGGILLDRVRGSYSVYLPVKLTNFNKKDPHQTLAFNVQAGTIVGDLPPYEAFSLGGVNSVRGYDEGDLGAGRSFLQATAEYRFPLFSIISGALFVDYGTTLGTQGSVPGNPGGVRNKPGSGYGYGLGVRVQTPLGPIRIDYGINDLGKSRIHFGIGERF